jgi:hypothetical protein
LFVVLDKAFLKQSNNPLGLVVSKQTQGYFLWGKNTNQTSARQVSRILYLAPCCLGEEIPTPWG